MKKDLDMLRSSHALDVSTQILDRLEHSSDIVTPIQEMTLALLTEIMFNTAVIADLSENPNERRTHDNQRDQ